MPRVRIFLHAEGPPDLETTDPSTVEALRSAFPEQSQLVMAHDAAEVLSKVRPLWASTLKGCEESHMVTIEFQD